MSSWPKFVGQFERVYSCPYSDFFYLFLDLFLRFTMRNISLILVFKNNDSSQMDGYFKITWIVPLNSFGSIFHLSKICQINRFFWLKKGSLKKFKFCFWKAKLRLYMIWIDLNVVSKIANNEWNKTNILKYLKMKQKQISWNILKLENQISWNILKLDKNKYLEIS